MHPHTHICRERERGRERENAVICARVNASLLSAVSTRACPRGENSEVC